MPSAMPTAGTVPAWLAPAGQLAAGELHVCLLRDGTVLCIGNNSVGQLGNGTPDVASGWSRVLGLPRVVFVSAVAGDHTCALAVDGSVYCWGDNSSGQCGVDLPAHELESSRVLTPALVPGVQASSVVAGPRSTCAVRVDGHVTCWGENVSGELGSGVDRQATAVPREVAGLGNVTQVASGGFGDSYHTCALSTAGEVSCWGNNLFHQIDDGLATSTTPRRVDALGSMRELALGGGTRSCFRSIASEAWCIGHESFDAGAKPEIPQAVRGQNVLRVGLALNHSCALTDARRVVCWTVAEKAPDVKSITLALGDVVDVTAGRSLTYLRTSDGAVWRWRGFDATDPNKVVRIEPPAP